MPIDPIISLAISLCSTAIAVGVAWGVNSNRLLELTRRQDEIEKRHERIEEDYVTFKHLEAVIGPMGRAMDEIQRDIKKILMLIGKNDYLRPS